jgi:hypothetical protein
MPTKKESVKEEEVEQVNEVKAAPAPTVKKGEKYFAFSGFEIEKLNIKVKAGEQFTPPQGWERNLGQEEFLLASKQKNSGGSSVGVCFSYQGEVVNPGEKNPDLRERRIHTAVLPLEVR